MPPHSFEAEQAVLGAMLLERAAILKARELLTADHFYVEHHRTIYLVACDLADRDTPVDLTTLGNALERAGALERIGGRPYLAALLEAVPTAAHLEHYAATVIERAALRRMVGLGAELIEGAHGGQDVQGLLTQAGDVLERVRKSTSGKKVAVLETMTAAELWRMDLPEPMAVIEGLIYEGLNLLVGAPKLGKSWLALQLAASVATGGKALGHYPVTRSEVLYLALEDSPARLRSRLSRLSEVDPGLRPESLDALHWRCEWPAGPEGVRSLVAWLRAHPEVRLVIIDTWAKVHEQRGPRVDAYQDDYASLSPLQRLGLQEHVAVVVLHHTRKAQSTDVFEEVSGTHGVTGSADVTIVVKRPRKESLGTLDVTGRDLAEARVAVEFEEGIWSYGGDAEEREISDAIQAILDVMTDYVKPMTATAVADALGKTRSNIAHQLRKMRERGLVVQTEPGKYLAVSASPTSLVERDHSLHSDHCDHSDHSVHSTPQGEGGVIGVINPEEGVITPLPGLEPYGDKGSVTQSDRSDQSDRPICSGAQSDDLGAGCSDA